MIKLGVESPVNCERCGGIAYRRTVQVENSKGSRPVAFDTHKPGLNNEQVLAALGRLDRFHERVHDLEAQLKALTEEDRKLSAGWLHTIELATVRPSACEVRTLIVPEANVQAWGFYRPIRLEPRPLKGASAKSILRDLKAGAEPIIQQMRRDREAGDF
jgi:hypothetical protein